MGESSFQSSVFRVQLRREEEKTSADYLCVFWEWLVDHMADSHSLAGHGTRREGTGLTLI